MRNICQSKKETPVATASVKNAPGAFTATIIAGLPIFPDKVGGDRGQLSQPHDSHFRSGADST
jgi:hypothetical protein